MRSKCSKLYLRWMLALACFALVIPAASANVSLFMEEPFGTFGAFNPTGHAAIYLSDVCADRPTRLRACHPGEMGVVISRYHHIHGYDWIAIPLIPYLYAVDDLADKPDTITPALEAKLRDDYRRRYLEGIAPDSADGSMPSGEWIQLIGSSYDRQIYGFQMDTTTEQDRVLIEKLNDSHNVSHFNLFYRNCADFSRSVLRTYYPDRIPRNSLADFGLTTPKHLARSLVKIGSRQPELGYQAFQIPQVDGTTLRSHHIRGIAESLVRSKRYAVPLAILSPTTVATLIAAYVTTGRFSAPKHAPTMAELSPSPVGVVLQDDSIAIELPTARPAIDTLACSENEAAFDGAMPGGSH
ncbi:MAG: hypothetical protein ACRYF4_10065 [Janthinobacterium lividum]